MSLGSNSIGAVALGNSDVSAGGTDNLLANSNDSASELTSPLIAQSHILTTVYSESGSELTLPLIAQGHSLTATDVYSTSELTLPVLSLRPVAVNDVYNVTNGVQLVVAAPGILTNDSFDCL